MKNATRTQCLRQRLPVSRIGRDKPETHVRAESLAAAFARNLVQARIRAGMKSYAAADMLGVSKSTWSQWESGERLPRLAMLAAIAECLNIRPCELLRSETKTCFLDR